MVRLRLNRLLRHQRAGTGAMWRPPVHRTDGHSMQGRGRARQDEAPVVGRRESSGGDLSPHSGEGTVEGTWQPGSSRHASVQPGSSHHASVQPGTCAWASDCTGESGGPECTADHCWDATRASFCPVVGPAGSDSGTKCRRCTAAGASDGEESAASWRTGGAPRLGGLPAIAVASGGMLRVVKS